MSYISVFAVSILSMLCFLFFFSFVFSFFFSWKFSLNYSSPQRVLTILTLLVNGLKPTVKLGRPGFGNARTIAAGTVYVIMELVLACLVGKESFAGPELITRTFTVQMDPPLLRMSIWISLTLGTTLILSLTNLV